MFHKPDSLGQILRSLLRLLWLTAGLSVNWRKFVYRQLCRKGDIPNFPFEKDFFGLRYQGNLNNNIEASIFFYGAFEKPLLFFLRDVINSIQEKHPQTKPVFMDVGANIGQHSLYMSKFAESVVAFEPFPIVNEKFKHQISLNNISNIELYEYGLSDKDELLSFYAPTGRNQGIGSFDENTATKGNREMSKLQLYKGDTFLDGHIPSGISLMKIDVEGFEKKVIAGLKATLLNNRPIIACEISYGEQFSFSNRADLIEHLPQDYMLFRFNTRNADGSKAKRRSSFAKRSGFYEIIESKGWRTSGQDDIIAAPVEKLDILIKIKTA